MARLTEQQWGELRQLWISTDRSIRDLAAQFGMAESNLRKRAKADNWGPRNAAERKRAIVAARMAGAQCAQDAHPDVGSEEAIQREAEQDVKDMQLAASVGRLALERCRMILEEQSEEEPGKPGRYVLRDPRQLKATTDAARSALETIRRARGLDAQEDGEKDLEIDWGAVVGRR